LKFVLQVLEVLPLCGSITKSGLQSADDDLSLYTEVGVACVSVGILVDLIWFSGGCSWAARASQSMLSRSGSVRGLFGFLS